MRSMKPGAGEGGWGWAGVREAGTWWAQVWGAPTQGVATLQLLPGPQDPLHRPKGPLGPQGKSGWLLTVWASLAKSCPANLTTSPTRRMGQKGALSGWKRQVFTSAAVRSGRRFPLGSGGGLTRGFPSSVSPLDARPPSPPPRAFPMACTATLLHEDGRPYPRLLCCALHVDAHPGEAELGHRWRRAARREKGHPTHMWA